MIRTILYITITLLLFVPKMNAQKITVKSSDETSKFELEIKNLSVEMDNTVKAEKKLLREKIKNIEKKYNKDEISYVEAEKQKKTVTKLHANNIKNKISSIEIKVHNLVQGKTDDEIATLDKNQVDFSINFPKKNILKRKNKRTHTYAVIAFGFNNLMDGDLNSIQNSDFKFGKSRFVELGWNNKRRLSKSSRAYFNYGLSLRYNKLAPKNNQYFVIDGDKSSLELYSIDLKSSKFRTTQLVIPLFFELDFSKSKTENGKTVYRRNKNWRLGFGGFAGVNIKAKQKLRYKQNGTRTKIETEGDYNVNNFVYGTQGFIGYKDISLYAKYDLQDLFSHSFKNQKNFSFGVRFDL